MNRFLVALLALLIAAVGVSRPAGPPVSAKYPSIVLGSVPLLSIREIEETCPGKVVMLPESIPVKRPGTFLVRVMVRVPFTEAVYVPRTTRVKRIRPVYREVTRQVDVPRDVFVPVTTREKNLRTVYREQTREEVLPKAVYVPVTQKQRRSAYRKVTRQVPCTQDVYVPVESREKKTRMVYVNEPMQITRIVPAIHMENTQVRDPSTGKMVTIQKPVCGHRQVTEMVDRYVLRPRVIEETVTNYRLERRTTMRTVEEYVLDPRPVYEDVTSYRLETRPVRETVKSYVCGPEVIEESVTRYRLETRKVRETVTDYVLESREVEEDVTTYHLEIRSGLREVEQIVCCHGEIIVPATRWQAVPLTHKHMLVEPLSGCVTTSRGGITAIGGATGCAPAHGVPAFNSSGISPE